MSKKQKGMLARILTTAALYALLLVLDHVGVLGALPGGWWPAALFLCPYLLIGWDVLAKALRNIRHGRVFDENFLMTVATVAAFCVQEYAEAVAVMLFYQVGELFQSCAVGRSRQSIADMMDIVPEYANVQREGTLVQVDPQEVAPGDVIVIKPGERIPLDGVVLQGESLLDTAALTGESVPRRAAQGDTVLSGCVNGSGTLHVQVSKAFEDSTVTRILELVENASSKKAHVENFITRFARIYTPIVTLCAALLAVVPPLFFGGSWGDWVYHACIFLVVSCPCALVISVPLGFFGGIGAAARIGVLIKGSNYLEAVADVDTLVLDKTGTLTKGEFKVTQLHPAGCSEEALLRLAATGEGYSAHPIAASIREAYGAPPDVSYVQDVQELAGRGISAVIDGQPVLLGSARLLHEKGITFTELESPDTVVYAAESGEYRGAIVIADTLRPGAQQALQDLCRLGVRRCVMLTGDRQKAAQAVAAALGVDEVHAELLPGDKVALVEQLLQRQPAGKKLAFVGDGINDAPVLSRADVGIAMGSMGSDAAIEAADIVIMDDDTRRIASTVRIARKTVRIVRQNIVFALGVKGVILLLGALRLATMWMAVIGDVGVAVLAILNSMRTLRAR